MCAIGQVGAIHAIEFPCRVWPCNEFPINPGSALTCRRVNGYHLLCARLCVTQHGRHEFPGIFVPLGNGRSQLAVENGIREKVRGSGP